MADEQLPPGAAAEEPEEDDGMLRMSFMDHLEELRARIIRALMGLGVAFAASIWYASDLWNIVRAPALRACAQNEIKNCLITTTASDAFQILWVKVPMLAALFLASPWLFYQVWAFVAPGLYKHERRWATPFVLCTAGLFVIGGMFAYFAAFPLGLGFLLSIGKSGDITTFLNAPDYFDLFVNITLGMGLVFEIPIIIFFLALLRIVSAGFLLRHSRYAILIIVIVAAIVTPTPDVVNLLIVAGPMTALYFGGVFAAYLLTLRRENKKFPWGLLLAILAGFFLLIAAGAYFAVSQYGYHLIPTYPFLVR